MICIKGKCEFYKEHMFQQSYFECERCNFSAKKSAKIPCTIWKNIGEMQNELKSLIECAKYIEEENKEE